MAAVSPSRGDRPGRFGSTTGESECDEHHLAIVLPTSSPTGGAAGSA
jgi:hypothetical protein